MEFTRPFIKAMGFTDYREFFIAFGNWYHTTDFTYNSIKTTSLFAGIKQFIRDTHDEEIAETLIRKYIVKL